MWLLVITFAVSGMVLAATRSDAASCSNLGWTVYTAQDYASGNDWAGDCGTIRLRHQYYPGGPAVWTKWFYSSFDIVFTTPNAEIATAQLQGYAP